MPRKAGGPRMPHVRNGLVAVIGLGVLVSCGGSTPAGPDAPAGTGGAAEWFVDRAASTGLEFVHDNGMSGSLYLAEIMGAGVALFDYDNDGDLDVYAVQGGGLGENADESRVRPPVRGDRLYRNDLTVRANGASTLRFVDVTSRSGIDLRSYGMGVAAADVDNDGWVDLYVTRLGQDVLLRNKGDGTFADITREAGIADNDWSIPASFFDFDRDGWLDLYVGHYVRYDIEHDTDCRGATGAADYCTPQVYPPMAGRLYRNRGDGTFSDVTVAAGIAAEYGPALGSSAADYDNDGWTDLYVANDGTANQLWLNGRGGTFRNGGLLAGVAVSASGRPEGSMGVDAGDVDNDGDEDLLVTNLFGEGTTLYVNDGTGTFDDAGAASGLRTGSLRYTGFGTAWLDVENDGWLDVVTVNGAVQMAQPFARREDPFPLGQPMQLLRNGGGVRFEDATAKAGEVFAAPAVGRGAAFGDVDNDGDIDILVANNNGPLRLLVNQVGNSRHWLGLRLITRDGRRDALGARVAVAGGDGLTRWRRVRTDGSYASASDPRVVIGLGDSPAPVRIRILWPDGSSEDTVTKDVDRWITLQQGASG